MKIPSRRHIRIEFVNLPGFLLILPACLLLLAGCSFLRIKKDVEYIHNSSILTGNISIHPYEKSAVVVVAYARHWGKTEIAHYTVLHEAGSYELLVPKGKYHIFAFGDRNGNLIYDKGEPAGYFGEPDTISAPAGGLVTALDLVIGNNEDISEEFPTGTPLLPEKPGKIHSTLAGAIVDLDDEIFSESYAAKGYWDAIEFYREVGGNIYFIEEYDPAKIPILFIHGANGSPRDWKHIVESIDRTRYQPWFFYYPSAASLKTMGNLLGKKLWDLQAKYHYQRIYITAHSMGGMVVRSFLMDYGRYFPYAKLFVSISTPWGGERLADIGARYSPAAIPSWLDMQPEGDFIKSLFRDRLPSDLDYYLLFGYRGNRNLLRPNNDGTVTLASQLDLRAQSEAKATFGLNEDHTGILASRESMNQYKVILAATDKRFSAESGRQGGSVRVRFSYESPETVPRTQAYLLLKPEGNNAEKKTLLLNPGDFGREFGPLPPGKYTARLVAAAFRAEPMRIPLSIEGGAISEIVFKLKPQGMFCGSINRMPQAGENPAGSYRNPDAEISVESIVLEGGAIRRSLSMTNAGNLNIFDFDLAETDIFSKGGFCFQNLPKGEYRLTIKAHDYSPLTVSQNIVPGKYVNIQPFFLTPLNSTPANPGNQPVQR